MAASKDKAKKVEKKIDPTNAEILRLGQQLTVKTDVIGALTKQLKASQRAEVLFQELAGVIHETTSPLKLIKDIRIVRSGDSGEFDLVILLSDEHADQVVSRSGSWGLEYYNFNIFRCRLQRLLEQIIKYATIHLPRHRFVRLWVLKLGDAVNGDIHGSGPKNHFGNTIKASLATGDAEAQFVAALVPYFEGGVHVVAVSGNHPRRSMRKDYGGPHDNFDYLVVSQMAARLSDYIAEGKVTVHAPEAWTAFVEIRGKLFCLNHGDDVKGFAGHPWYGFDRKNNRVQAMVARFNQRIDFFCYGHYHTDIGFPSAGARSLHSGAFPMTDPFAINALAAGNEPVQTLYVMDDKIGRVMDIPVYTRNEKNEQLYMAGKYNPSIGQNLLINTITPLPNQAGFIIHTAS